MISPIFKTKNLEMKYLVGIILTLMIACKSDKKYHSSVVNATQMESEAIREILKFQQDMNAAFKNPETSPLPDRYRKDFEGLDFFAPDTGYIVKASLERTPDAVPFVMHTTTDEKRTEVVYGIAHFQLNGAKHSLEIYQSFNAGFMGQLNRDILFLPFLDDTNGVETYGGGRYIDLTIPKGDTIEIDFNRAYNPYCVYNKKYSCPLVPRQNHLNTTITAGVKDFKIR